MAIYLSLGPSGAGKDTLLLAGRALLEGNSDVAFIQRHLTRNAASVTDLEISVTSDAFSHEAADRAALVGAVGRWPEEPCPVGAVALVCTTGESYACWQIVETIPLPSP